MRPAVPPQEKRARSAVLAKLVRAFDPPHAALVGTTQRVLVSDVAPRGDGQVYVGHTKAYVQVLLDAAPGLLGAVAEVYVTSSSRWHVDATVVRVLKKGPEDAYTPVVTAYAEGRDPLITGKGTPAGGLGKGQGQGEGEGDGEEGLMTVRVRGSVKDTRVIPVVSRESQRQSRRGDDDDARGRSTGRSTSTSETTGRDHGNDQTRTTVMGSWLERGWARAVCEMVSGKGGGDGAGGGLGGRRAYGRSGGDGGGGVVGARESGSEGGSGGESADGSGAGGACGGVGGVGQVRGPDLGTDRAWRGQVCRGRTVSDRAIPEVSSKGHVDTESCAPTHSRYTNDELF